MPPASGAGFGAGAGALPVPETTFQASLIVYDASSGTAEGESLAGHVTASDFPSISEALQWCVIVVQTVTDMPTTATDGVRAFVEARAGERGVEWRHDTTGARFGLPLPTPDSASVECDTAASLSVTSVSSIIDDDDDDDDDDDHGDDDDGDDDDEDDDDDTQSVASTVSSLSSLSELSDSSNADSENGGGVDDDDDDDEDDNDAQDNDGSEGEDDGSEGEEEEEEEEEDGEDDDDDDDDIPVTCVWRRTPNRAEVTILEPWPGGCDIVIRVCRTAHWPPCGGAMTW